MFCAHCGSSVGDGARFCSACGKPAGAPQSVAASGPAVFCQIEKYANQGAFTGWTIYFYADAVGPNGSTAPASPSTSGAS
jgi:hypothetical protein